MHVLPRFLSMWMMMVLVADERAHLAEGGRRMRIFDDYSITFHHPNKLGPRHGSSQIHSFASDLPFAAGLAATRVGP